jgi:hypothetical protein
MKKSGRLSTNSVSVDSAETNGSRVDKSAEFPSLTGMMIRAGKLTPEERQTVRTYLVHLLVWANRSFRSSARLAKGENEESSWTKQKNYWKNVRSAIRYAITSVALMEYGDRFQEEELKEALGFALSKETE